MKLRSALLVALVLSACGGDTPSVDGGPEDAGSAGCEGIANGGACGEGHICLAGACVESRCGDGYIDALRGEQCEDGNEIAFDGCDPPRCTFTCDEDADCTDGDPCNGNETCTDHVCADGTPLEENTACATADTSGTCRQGSCVSPGCGNGFLDDGEECDDDNDVEGDGCDNDCSFSCDETTSCEDNNVCNGIAICQLATHTCMPGTAPECSDGNACTADSCDPVAGCVHALAVDVDEDGHAPTSLGPCGDDCNDGDATIYTGAQELCDAIDQDCDGDASESTAPTWYVDCDGDGYASASAATMTQCDEPAATGCGGGWTTTQPGGDDIDCNDAIAAIRPRGTEIAGDPADADEDCDGTVMCYPNVDGDAYRASTPIASTDGDCADTGEARESVPGGDCSDLNAAAYPGAPEIPSDTGNGDENCDGMVTCYPDDDGDGYGAGTPFTTPDGACDDAGEASRPELDSCPLVASGDLSDADADGAGDVCDLCPDTSNAGGVRCPTLYDLKRGLITPGDIGVPGPRFTFNGLVVTGVTPQAYWAQVPMGHPDYAGAEYSGIFVFIGASGPLYADGSMISRGDTIDVSGRFISFNGQLELSPATTTRSSSSYPMPPPVFRSSLIQLTEGGMDALSYEGVLIEIGFVQVTAVNMPRPGEIIVNNTLHIDPYMSGPFVPFPLIGETYSRIVGVLAYRFMHNALFPRDPGDMVR